MGKSSVADPKLAHLAIEGILVDHEFNEVDDDDLRLLKELTWAADLYAGRVAALHRQAWARHQVDGLADAAGGTR